MKRYNDFSKKQTDAVIMEPIIDDLDIGVVEPTVNELEETNVVTAGMTPEVEEEPAVIGIVEGCIKLNVRAKPSPNSEIVAVINEKKEVMIDMDKSTNDWFSVCTEAGLEGYCMKKFVVVKH